MNKRRYLRKDPRDFTGGGIFGLPKEHRSTGNSEIDRRISSLVDEWSCGASAELVQEMIVTAFKLGKDCPPEGDMKLFNRALKEMREAIHKAREPAEAMS